MSILHRPAVEQDLGRSIRPVVAVLVGDEQEMRGGADPDAAEADRQAADQVEPLGEHLAGIEPSVAVGVLEDENAVARLVVADAAGVRVRFGDPEPAPVVDRHGDRLDDVGLAGEERDAEPRRHGHRAGGLLGAEPGMLVDVAGRRPPPGRDIRARGVQPEVVEVDVAPADRLAIHQADPHVLARVSGQVDDGALHILEVVARRAEDDLGRCRRARARRPFRRASRPRRGSWRTARVTRKGADVNVPTGASPPRS